ncbi:hypothetical protein AAVH_27160 [Aphelenchoides avenae]|nr:hypothetical protein AAVH_27160 [Aphelenchus avenae]
MGARNSTEQNSNEQNSNEQNSNEQNSTEQNSNEQNSNEQSSNEQNSNEQNSKKQNSKKQNSKKQNSKKQHAIHVSNASAYVIEVNCDTDRIFNQQRSGKYGITVGPVSASVDNARQAMMYHTATSAGGTRVAPGKSLCFTPDCSKAKTVYAAIFQEQEGENKRPLCGGFQVKANRAIIVAHDGGIHIAPDTSKPWVDTNGDDHFQINRAHVANGSVQTIWVKCNTNREYVRKESDELPEHIEEERAKGGRTETSYTDLYVAAKSRGFIKINAREAYMFKKEDRKQGEEEDNATVFFAVYQEQERKKEQEDGCTTTLHKLYDDFPTEANENVIIGNDGVIHRAQMGKVWTDTAGKNHRKTQIGNDIEEGSSQERAAIDAAIVSTRLPTDSTA